MRKVFLSGFIDKLKKPALETAGLDVNMNIIKLVSALLFAVLLVRLLLEDDTIRKPLFPLLVAVLLLKVLVLQEGTI